MKSETFKLSKQILQLLEKHAITVATPVQKKIIPAILSGKDVLVQSETGSGKTLSFAIPIIEATENSKDLIALIIVPTRELCKQISDEFEKFSHRHIVVSSVYGGVSIENQMRKTRRANIVVATPGRLLDIIERRGINLKSIKYLVLDEADRMLDMGFIRDIEQVLKHIPEGRQTLLFSATISKEISRLSGKYLKDPISVSFEPTIKPEFLRQTYYRVVSKQKLPLLIHLLKEDRELTLVFCNRKSTTETLAKELTRKGILAKCLNGNMTQDKRERVTDQFRRGKFSVLIATDVAARGLHIEGITHVYNFEIPKETDSYTHRVGRTARAGKKGEAISFVATGEDEKFFKQILFNHKGVINLKYADNFSHSEIPITEDKKERRFSRDEMFGKRKSSERSGSFRRDRNDGDRRRTGKSDGYKRRDRDDSGYKRRDRDDGGYKRKDREDGGFKRRDREDGGFKRRDREDGGFKRRDGEVGGFKRRDGEVGGFKRRDREDGGFKRRDREDSGFKRRDREDGDFKRKEKPETKGTYQKVRQSDIERPRVIEQVKEVRSKEKKRDFDDDKFLRDLLNFDDNFSKSERKKSTGRSSAGKFGGKDFKKKGSFGGFNKKRR